MPLNKEEYILDVTTELLKNGQTFYLIFCRSVWVYPLRLDSQLYIEVIFNQVAPDYLEGLLLVTPNDKLLEEMVPDVSRIASLLHRAADMEQTPTKDEVKYLLPKPILPMRDIRPQQWVEMVQRNWTDMSALTTTEAKAQCLDILQKWPLFGSCFFAVKVRQQQSHEALRESSKLIALSHFYFAAHPERLSKSHRPYSGLKSRWRSFPARRHSCKIMKTLLECILLRAFNLFHRKTFGDIHTLKSSRRAKCAPRTAPCFWTSSVAI